MAELPRIESPSLRAHRRQRTWQILVPLFGVSAVIIAAAVLFVRSGPPQTRVGADISIIWILIPLLTFALLLVLVLALLIYGFYRLFLVMPRVTTRVQGFSFRVESGVRGVTDRIARPVIWIRQVGAALESILSLGSHR